MDKNSKYTLRNGVEIPVLGFGTWQLEDEEVIIPAIDYALKAGFRHIDTASAYENERLVAKAIKRAGFKREDIFITSKVQIPDRGYARTMEAFKRTTQRLGTDYLDLYLIHWPAPTTQKNWQEINRETWRALMDLYKEGKVRAIGVSNFHKHHLDTIMDCEIKPMVNQLKVCPGVRQQEVVDYCKENGILVEAWSPIASGKQVVLTDSTLEEIAKKYNKSIAQICVRWHLQNGICPLPRSTSENHIKENIDVFDFEISEEDMQKINAIDNGLHVTEPDKLEFFD